jgi:hypothetical protein
MMKKDILKLIQPEYKEYFERLPLLKIIKYFDNGNYNLYQNYRDLFILCFEDDVFDLIENDEELQYYLDLIVQYFLWYQLLHYQ